MSGYSYTTEKTGVGEQFCFKGPGMPQYANGVHLKEGTREAERIAWLLARAFEAGREDKAREVRAALGVPR